MACESLQVGHCWDRVELENRLMLELLKLCPAGPAPGAGELLHQVLELARRLLEILLELDVLDRLLGLERRLELELVFLRSLPDADRGSLGLRLLHWPEALYGWCWLWLKGLLSNGGLRPEVLSGLRSAPGRAQNGEALELGGGSGRLDRCVELFPVAICEVVAARTLGQLTSGQGLSVSGSRLARGLSGRLGLGPGRGTSWGWFSLEARSSRCFLRCLSLRPSSELVLLRP